MSVYSRYRRGPASARATATAPSTPNIVNADRRNCRQASQIIARPPSGTGLLDEPDGSTAGLLEGAALHLQAGNQVA